jgi:hypothetical protein
MTKRKLRRPAWNIYSIRSISRPVFVCFDINWSCDRVAAQTDIWGSLNNRHRTHFRDGFSRILYQRKRNNSDVVLWSILSVVTIVLQRLYAVETQGSGSGDDLTVAVIYNGRSVPAEIDQEGLNRYHVSFIPVGSGTYTIHVYYAGAEVTGRLFYILIARKIAPYKSTRNVALYC